jgi:hypothetical protein
VYTGFEWGDLSERDNSEGIGLDGKIDNIKMALQEVGWVGTDWTGWAEDRDSIDWTGWTEDRGR